MIVPPLGSPRPSRPVVSQNVSMRDLPATVVDLLNLEAGAPFPGTSLARLWENAPMAATIDSPVFPSSPAVSEVVPTNPLDPDPAKMLEERRAWASLAEGDLIYIRVRYGDVDREELYNLRDDVRQSRNLADDPAHRSVLERMRAKLDGVTGGPLTPQQFRI